MKDAEGTEKKSLTRKISLQFLRGILKQKF